MKRIVYEIVLKGQDFHKKEVRGESGHKEAMWTNVYGKPPIDSWNG